MAKNGVGVVKWHGSVNKTAVDIVSLDNVTREWWTPDSFQFTVPNDPKHRSLLLGDLGYEGAGKDVVLKREVNNTGNEELKIKGPVYGVRVGNQTIQVRGKGKGIELARSYTGDNEYFAGYSSRGVMSHIMKGTDFELGETAAGDPTITCRFYTENKWRALMDTAKNFANWEARVNYDNSSIDFKKMIGKDRSESFTMQHGYNVISDGFRDVNYEDIVTRVVVRGEGEGFNQIKASAVDTAAESVYWPRTEIYDDRSIDNQALAQNVANSRLSATNTPRDQISLQTTDMFDPAWTLDIGDTVKLEWSRMSLSHNMRIKKLTYNWNVNSGETINMDLNYAGIRFASAMAGTNPGIRQEVQNNARHPQGATNIWQINDHDNVSSSFPMYVPFRIPDICEKVNRALLSLKIKPFRYYSKETAASAEIVGTGTGGSGAEVLSSYSGGDETTSSGGGTSPTTSAGGDEITSTRELFQSSTNAGGSTESTTASGGGSTSSTENSSGFPTQGVTEGPVTVDIGSSWGSVISWTSGDELDNPTDTWSMFVFATLNDMTDADTVEFRAYDSGGLQTWNGHGGTFNIDTDGHGKYAQPQITDVICGNSNLKDDKVILQAQTGGGTVNMRVSGYLYGEGPHTHSFTADIHSHSTWTPAHSHGLWVPPHSHTQPTHTHTVTVPAHTHDQPAHAHTLSTTDHTHSVTIPAHSHTVTTGISTVSYDGPSLTVTVAVEKYNSGVWDTAWSATTSFSDVDVRDYISSPNSEYQIRVTPNQDCRLETQLYLEGWVQSR